MVGPKRRVGSIRRKRSKRGGLGGLGSGMEKAVSGQGWVRGIKK